MLESQQVQSSAFDMQYYQKLKAQTEKNSDAQLETVAKQFEALFFTSLMKEMRKSSDWLNEDSPFTSQNVKTFEEMLDVERSTQLANSKGLGIADALIQQLDKLNGIKNRNKTLFDFSKKETPIISLDKAVEKVAVDGALSSPLKFVKALWPYAKEAAKSLNLSPKVLLAQAALETGWGRSIIQNEKGNSSYNLFNIKVSKDWDGETARVKTAEYINGEKEVQTADFKQYQSFKESFNDYVNLIKQKKRYSAALKVADNPKAYLQQLERGGYATDPDYADKVFQIYRGNFLSDLLKHEEVN